MSGSKNIVTGKVIFSFFKLWTPTPFEPGDDPKFSVSLLINKSDTDTIARLKQEYDTVLMADFDGSLPYGAKPGYLVDGLIRYPDNPFYADKFILQCGQSADRPPQILDASRQPIMDRSKAGTGFEGHAIVSFYGYQGGSKGIASTIHGVMVFDKVAELGGETVDAASMFGAELGDSVTTPAQHEPENQPPFEGSKTPPKPNEAQKTPPKPSEPAKPVMTEKAEGMSYEAWIKNGWTDEGLRSNGYMI